MANIERPKTFGGLRVLVAGAGVAGLETVLALRALAGDLVDLELLAAEPRFWYRPLSVGEPFNAGQARHFEIAQIAGFVAAGLTLGRLASVDPDVNLARTSNGAEIEYDALVVACGAQPRPALAGAITFRGPADTDVYRQLLAEAESRRIGSIVFAVPAPRVWTLPLYELALLTATSLRRHDAQLELTLVTPEAAPLAAFGEAASDAVRALLEDRGVGLRVGCYPRSYASGRLDLDDGATLVADRVVALPRLEGPQILGIPQDPDGFIATDLSGRISGLTNVYAAGDITDFPIKQGGIAAEQADAVAEGIAALAGARVQPQRFRPVLRGLLLTGGAPRYLRREVHGSEATSGDVAEEALWWPPAKIVGRYLAPFLARLGELELQPPPGGKDGALEIEIDLADQLD